jgi:hypothetical protein
MLWNHINFQHLNSALGMHSGMALHRNVRQRRKCHVLAARPIPFSRENPARPVARHPALLRPSPGRLRLVTDANLVDACVRTRTHPANLETELGSAGKATRS